MTDSAQLLTVLDHIRVVVQNGLEHTDDAEQRERYEEILDAVSSYYGDLLDTSPTSVREQLRAEDGHVTPKVGVVGIVFDDSGRVLVRRQTTGDEWGLPSGTTEPGERIRTAVRRVTKSATGLDVEPEGLAGLYERKPGEDSPHHFVDAAYYCTRAGGTPSDDADVRYREPQAVSSWYDGHGSVVRDAVLERDRHVETEP